MMGAAPRAALTTRQEGYVMEAPFATHNRSP